MTRLHVCVGTYYYQSHYVFYIGTDYRECNDSLNNSGVSLGQLAPIIHTP